MTSAWRSARARLEDRLAVVVDPEPLERLEDLVDVLLRRALAVGVLDAQDELAAAPAGEQPVEQGGAGAADVEGARRRGSEADAHRALTLPSPPPC